LNGHGFFYLEQYAADESARLCIRLVCQSLAGSYELISQQAPTPQALTELAPEFRRITKYAPAALGPACSGAHARSLLATIDVLA
jgi:hypothetical protein